MRNNNKLVTIDIPKAEAELLKEMATEKELTVSELVEDILWDYIDRVNIDTVDVSDYIQERTEVREALYKMLNNDWGV